MIPDTSKDLLDIQYQINYWKIREKEAKQMIESLTHEADVFNIIDRQLSDMTEAQKSQYTVNLCNGMSMREAFDDAFKEMSDIKQTI